MAVSAARLNWIYQTRLGRSPEPGDLEKWNNGTYGATEEAAIDAQVASSEEGTRYAAAHGAPGGGTIEQHPSPGGTTAPPPAPPAGNDPGAFLLRLLQNGMDRDQAIAQTAQQFNLQPGQDGYPLYYPGNNTIGLKGSYLANVGGTWNQVTRGPEGGGGGNTGNPAGVGSLLEPFTEQFVPPDTHWDMPELPVFDFADFVPKDPKEILSDPNYLMRFDQGNKALTNARAAEGLLRTGGTLKDFINYGQGMASNEMKNIFDRDLSTWGANENKAWQAFQPKITQYQTLAQTRQRQSELDWNRAWQQYMGRFDIFNRNKKFPADVLGDMARTGASAI